MFAGVLDIFLAKLSSALVSYLDVAIRAIVVDAMKSYELGKVASVEKELIRIETELKNKPRITEDEATDIARRINNARNRL
jgi:hypothetical protein